MFHLYCFTHTYSTYRLTSDTHLVHVGAIHTMLDDDVISFQDPVDLVWGWGHPSDEHHRLVQLHGHVPGRLGGHCQSPNTTKRLVSKNPDQFIHIHSRFPFSVSYIPEQVFSKSQQYSPVKLKTAHLFQPNVCVLLCQKNVLEYAT